LKLLGQLLTGLGALIIALLAIWEPDRLTKHFASVTQDVTPSDFAGDAPAPTGSTGNPQENPTPDPNTPPGEENQDPNLPPNENPYDPDAVPSGDYNATNQFILSQNNGVRGDLDALYFTSYGQPKDTTPDQNTRERRGFSNNLLREGSVALSPDIYNTYRPEIGAAVYVNDQFIGYYEDRAPSSYNGNQYGKVIDVYDPQNKLGPVLKKMNSGTFNLSFGPGRAQISNP